MSSYIHPNADVANSAIIGDNTKVWGLTQIRERSRVGQNCNIGRNVFIDVEVIVGNNCKIQNNALIYDGVILEDGVFVGPAVTFTNDKLPRAINPDGSLKGADDWVVSKTLVKYGAAIGANATIVTGVTLGKFCMVGSGSVVTRDVENFALVVGNPARRIGYVCKCGNRLELFEEDNSKFICKNCSRKYVLVSNNMEEDI